MKKKQSKKKFQNKFPKQIQKEKIKKQRAQYREKYMEEMSKEFNPSARTLKDIFAIDDEEMKHIQYLEATYRDRAKERRSCNLGEFIEEKDEQEQNDIIEDPVIDIQPLNQKIEQNEMKKGLDMEMYQVEMKQLEKYQDQQKKVKKNEYENGKRKSVIKKSFLASAIERVLNEKENLNLFKPNLHYEYEIDNILEQTLPKCIVKKPKKQELEDPRIMLKISENLIQRISEFVKDVESGKPMKSKRDKANKMKIQEPQKEIEKEEIDKTDEDAIFSEGEDNKFDQIKSWLPSFTQKETNDQDQDQIQAQNEPSRESVFANLTSNPKYNHTADVEGSEINSETQNQIKQIQKSVLLQSKSRLEQKLAELDNDEYIECYPSVDLTLSELKEAGGLAANYQIKRFSSKKHGKQPSKIDRAKEHSKFHQVNQIMKEKQNKK